MFERVEPLKGWKVDVAAFREGKASLPIAAGEQTMTVSVTISWASDSRRQSLIPARMTIDGFWVPSK